MGFGRLAIARQDTWTSSFFPRARKRKASDGHRLGQLICRASGRGVAFVGRRAGLGGGRWQIFTELQLHPFARELFIRTWLVVNDRAQAIKMTAKSEMIRAEPEGVGISDHLSAGAAKGQGAIRILKHQDGEMYVPVHKPVVDRTVHCAVIQIERD
jgi:hypothetical protein